MIVTVTPNPALDLTYPVDALAAGTVHRVQSVESRPGGKGVNVARILHALGRPVTAAGPLGGAVGERVRAGLESYRVAGRFTRVAGETRRTVTVVDRYRREVTGFHEPGPALTADDWARLLAQVVPLLPAADVLVCSGSLPPGSPDTALAPFIAAARRAGVPTVVDTGGRALPHAVAAGASLVKPNAGELTEATGVTDPVAALRALRGDSATAVVASLGGAGLVVAAEQGLLRARPGQQVSGNPTGAGDAVVAALAAGLADRRGWRDLLTDAVALSAATILAPVAGEFDPAAYALFRHTVEITER